MTQHTNPFQHPYLLTVLSLEAQQAFYQAASPTETTRGKLDLLHRQIQALTCSNSYFTKKFNYSARILWPSPVLAVPLGTNSQQDPHSSREYLFCNADSYLPQFSMNRPALINKVPSLHIWNSVKRGELNFSSIFIVGDIIDVQKMEQRRSAPSTKTFQGPASIPAIVLQQAVFSQGRALAMNVFFPEQANSPYVQTLQSLSQAGQILPLGHEEVQKKLTQALFTLCSKAGKITKLPNDSTLVFLVETGEPIAELVEKEKSYFIKGLENHPTELPATLGFSELSEEETQKIKNYLTYEREAQAALPTELAKIRSHLVREKNIFDSNQPPRPFKGNPISYGLTLSIGIIIGYRILHLYRTGRLTSSNKAH